MAYRTDSVPACVKLCRLPSLSDVTRVEWPVDASLEERVVLCDARVVAADSSGGFEFPHRSIQEYFCALAVHLELAKAPAPADSRVAAASESIPSPTAYHIWDTWNKAKLPGVPREVILAVLLSDAAGDDLMQWALSLTNWSKDAVSMKQHALFEISSRVSLAAVGSLPCQRCAAPPDHGPALSPTSRHVRPNCICAGGAMRNSGVLRLPGSLRPCASNWLCG